MNTPVKPPDGGMFYAETNLGRFIVEPFNAASAFIFLLLAFYWIIRLRNSYNTHRFLTLCSAVLFVGATGGTLYHAFRSSRIYLFMDWVPILLLCLMAGFYFLLRSTSKWWHALLLFAAFFGAQVLLWQLVNAHNRKMAININYFLMSLLVLVPLSLFLVRQQFRHVYYVLGSVLAFALALFFRIYDTDGWLPMGTHFLWHVFGAAACQLMFLFIYHSQGITPAKQQ